MQLLRGEGGEVPPCAERRGELLPWGWQSAGGQGNTQGACLEKWALAMPRAPGAVYLCEVGARSSLGPADLIFRLVLLPRWCSAAGNAGGCFPWC